MQMKLKDALFSEVTILRFFSKFPSFSANFQIIMKLILREHSSPFESNLRNKYLFLVAANLVQTGDAALFSRCWTCAKKKGNEPNTFISSGQFKFKVTRLDIVDKLSWILKFNGLFTLPDSDSDSESKPNGYIALFHTAQSYSYSNPNCQSKSYPSPSPVM